MRTVLALVLIVLPVAAVLSPVVTVLLFGAGVVLAFRILRGEKS